MKSVKDDTMIEIYFCSKCSFPLGKISLVKFKNIFNKIRQQHRGTYSYLLKHDMNYHFIFVFIDVECPRCKEKVKACFYSRFFSDSPELNLKEFYLINIKPSTFEFLDGIYKRIYVRKLLEAFMKRWSYLAMKTIIHSPFIGPFPRTNQDKTDDWKWILKRTNPYNLLIITRKVHANYLKRLPYFELTKSTKKDTTDWFTSILDAYEREEFEDKIFEGIIKPIFAEKSLHIFDKSHAKFYAGFVNGYYETIITSYNIFKPAPKNAETFTVLNYNCHYFHEKFLAPLQVPDENLHFIPDSVLEMDDSVPVIIYNEKEGEIEALQDESPISKWIIVEKYSNIKPSSKSINP